MTRWQTLVVCAIITWALATTSVAPAQPPIPGGPAGAVRPPFSPYLNLTRSGATPAMNYYGLVRPEQQFRQSLQDLRGGLAANQQAIGAFQSDLTGLSATGHDTGFLNLGGYFMNSGPSLGSRTTAAAPTRASGAPTAGVSATGPTRRR